MLKSVFISSRIAGQGELFSLDTSNSGPQASSPRSELSAKWAVKNVIVSGRADQNLSNKTLASYFQSKKRKSKVVRRRRRRTKKKNNSIDLRRAFTPASVSIVDLLSLGCCRSLSKSVVFGFFKFLASLKKRSTIHEVCLFFFRLSRAERNFSQGCWRPRGNALSMARQPDVGRACGWLVSAVLWSWVEKSSDFPDRFRNEKWNPRAHSVRGHLQHFQSHGSYRAHAIVYVVKSSLRQLDMYLKIGSCR